MKGRVTWDKEGNAHYEIDGEEVSEAEFREALNPVYGDIDSHRSGWSRPLHSEALAVHPSQIKEAVEYDRANGVQTDYDPLGRPIFRDRDHKRRYCELHGAFDKDGGYSDSQRGSSRARNYPPEAPPELAHLEEAESERGVEKRSSVRYFV